jgi:hypothetical protein
MVILLHELGHALPALVFTRGPVAMYLGSYGDSANSWRMQIGRLEIFFKKRSLFWPGGMCVSSNEDMTTAQYVVMLLGGVFVSFVVAAVGFYASLMLDLHGSVKLYTALLAVMAAVSLITNLIPWENANMVSDGLLLKRMITGDKLVAAFSPELQALIARSREVAIDLGSDCISTQHLFLADCAMPYQFSLAKVFFQDQEAYKVFYEQHKEGPINDTAGSLPLTTEFEEALRLTAAARRHGFSHILYPSHLFIAASEMPDSLFGRVAPDTPDLPQLLLTHYRQYSELWAD